MKNPIRLNLLALAVIAILGASLPAAASELTDDLRTPFEPVTNPFGRAHTQPLASAPAAALKALLEKCAYTPVKATSAIAVYGESALRAGCESSLTPNYVTDAKGERFVGNMLAVHAAGLDLQVVSWDGSDSDGGDEQALGIYDANGSRIATYTGLFVDGNVLDGLAHAVGAVLPKVEN